jgi:hypothetical protein
MYYLGIAHFEASKQAKDRLKERQESKQALQKALALNVQADLATDAKRVLTELE